MGCAYLNCNVRIASPKLNRAVAPEENIIRKIVVSGFIYSEVQKAEENIRRKQIRNADF